MNKQLSSNLLILSPQVISTPRGGSHDWVRQTPQSFETTVLNISQMTYRPRGELHNWIWQTHQRFEITILKYSLSTEYKLNFRQI
jgi:phenylpropionate dioxygenase-like ring-hydroxylating dioxygenase large terminal subunit